MEKYYTCAEVAASLRVHLKTVYNWAKSGKLRTVKAGHFRRISQSSLDEFLQKAPDKE